VKARDRRGAPRAKADWPVRLETFERGIIDGHVVDISTSGVRVRASADLPVGAAVTLRITLPRGAERLEVVARVARRDADALALDFIGMPETEARRVEPLVAGWDGRRRAPRASRPLAVTIRVPRGAVGHGKTLDLSPYGARIATDLALQPGDTAKLEIESDGDEDPLRLPSVVWSMADRGSVFVFVNLREGEFDRLNRLVRRLLERGG
jgi:PilZ domain